MSETLYTLWNGERGHSELHYAGDVLTGTSGATRRIMLALAELTRARVELDVLRSSVDQMARVVSDAEALKAKWGIK